MAINFPLSSAFTFNSARTELLAAQYDLTAIRTNSRYRRWRQISGEIYILIIMADCVIGERGVAPGGSAGWGGLASTRRDRSLIFRRKVLALSKS